MSLTVSNVTSIRWKLVDFCKQRSDAGSNGLVSQSFSLSTRSSVQLVLFVYDFELYVKDAICVVLEQADEKPIEANVKIWVESTTGQQFGKAFFEKQTFSEMGDYCDYDGISSSNRDFWNSYENHGTFFVCCEITDLNGRAAPTTDHDKEFLQNQLSFYERMHDAVIKVGRTEFKIFKSIFMCQSEVFERMFLSNFKERATNEVRIKDIDENTMKHFVKWFYTGQLENDSPIEKLFIAADKYDVKILKMCNESMLESLDATNAFQRLIIASMHIDNDLKQATLDLISGLPTDAFTDFFGSDEWIEFYGRNPGAAKDVAKFIREKMRR